MTRVARVVIADAISRDPGFILVPGVEISARNDRIFCPVSYGHAQSGSLKILLSASEPIDLSVDSSARTRLSDQPGIEGETVTISPCIAPSVCGIPSNSQIIGAVRCFA